MGQFHLHTAHTCRIPYNGIPGISGGRVGGVSLAALHSARFSLHVINFMSA